MMFEVDSYLKKPQCNITDLSDAVKNPQNYFVEITDSAGLKEICTNVDFQYLNGAICLRYYGEILLDMRHWDLVDQLWAYILNVIEDVLQKGEGSTYFPDQPVKFMLRQTSKELLLLSIGKSEVTRNVLPKKELLTALLQGAEQFFTCMINMFSSKCDYSHELDVIARIKTELQ